MSPVLPKRHEAQQLCRLRALRVQRAREGVAKAQDEVKRVEEIIRQRQREVASVRRASEDLQNAMVTSLVPALPRWSQVAGAQRERLADRLERVEYALVGAEHDLEAAQEALQVARAELTRALAREDTVRDLAQQTKRAFAAQREMLAERDLEDLGRPAHDRGG